MDLNTPTYKTPSRKAKGFKVLKMVLTSWVTTLVVGPILIMATLSIIDSNGNPNDLASYYFLMVIAGGIMSLPSLAIFYGLSRWIVGSRLTIGQIKVNICLLILGLNLIFWSFFTGFWRRPLDIAIYIQ
ncbi:MAG: hypothetical protein AAFU03_18565, partial [Bacteroidota bacterium]